MTVDYLLTDQAPLAVAVLNKPGHPRLICIFEDTWERHAIAVIRRRLGIHTRRETGVESGNSRHDHAKIQINKVNHIGPSNTTLGVPTTKGESCRWSKTLQSR